MQIIQQAMYIRPTHGLSSPCTTPACRKQNLQSTGTIWAVSKTYFNKLNVIHILNLHPLLNFRKCSTLVESNVRSVCGSIKAIL